MRIILYWNVLRRSYVFGHAQLAKVRSDETLDITLVLIIIPSCVVVIHLIVGGVLPCEKKSPSSHLDLVHSRASRRQETRHNFTRKKRALSSTDILVPVRPALSHGIEWVQGKGLTVSRSHPYRPMVSGADELVHRIARSLFHVRHRLHKGTHQNSDTRKITKI